VNMIVNMPKAFYFFSLCMLMLWINERKVGSYSTPVIMNPRITDQNLKVDLEWKPQLSLIKKSKPEMNHILVI
jgi:hypothetical protein